jgi:signal transduction histidine kinase
VTTVLNVDDNPATRYARSRILKQAGFDVTEAATGQQALELVLTENPHIALLDVRLPDMSGIDVCRRFKADPRTMGIPVIQISATFVTERDQLLGLEGGAEVYLTEPVEPQELITVVRTLLRLRSVERTLGDAETRWRRLFGSNIIGIFVAENTRVLEANDVFLRMIGVPRTAFNTGALDLGSITPAQFAAEDAVAMNEILCNGSCATYEKEFICGDGSRMSALVGGARLANDRWLGFALDISDRRRVEAERERLLLREQEARREAERATQIRDEFLANLSHELRTPMSTITGWLHLLRTGRLGKDETASAFEAIERATRSQNQLIEDLLDVSRIVAGKLCLEMGRVSLGKLIESSIESVAPSARTKGVTIRQDVVEEGLAVSGDGRRLQQVFWNLLVNAVKFTPSGGEVSLSVERGDQDVRVLVKDTGEGIAAEFLPYVFERFRQADGSTTRRHSGMGLGLAIVRHVVELHGGTVVARSEGSGKGATFIVQLPLARQEAQETSPPVEAGHAALKEKPLQGRSVLVLDDDPDAREMIGTLLRQCGAECRIVESAGEAFDVLDRWNPAVVVSDIGMAGIDGYGFINRLRQRYSQHGGKIPAVALTAFARREDRERALQSGYDEHVTKPIDPQALVDTIIRVTRR